MLCLKQTGCFFCVLSGYNVRVEPSSLLSGGHIRTRTDTHTHTHIHIHIHTHTHNTSTRKPAPCFLCGRFFLWELRDHSLDSGIRQCLCVKHCTCSPHHTHLLGSTCLSVELRLLEETHSKGLNHRYCPAKKHRLKLNKVLECDRMF